MIKTTRKLEGDTICISNTEDHAVRPEVFNTWLSNNGAHRSVSMFLAFFFLLSIGRKFILTFEPYLNLFEVLMCVGLIANQWKKLTPHKYLARGFKSELHFNWKITINAMIHKNLFKSTKSEYNLAPDSQGGGHNQIKQWLQCCWSDVHIIFKSSGSLEVEIPLWMSSGGGVQVPKPQDDIPSKSRQECSEPPLRHRVSQWDDAIPLVIRCFWSPGWPLQMSVLLVPLRSSWPISRDDPLRTVLLLPQRELPELSHRCEGKKTLPCLTGLSLFPYLIWDPTHSLRGRVCTGQLLQTTHH